MLSLGKIKAHVLVLKNAKLLKETSKVILW